MIKMLLFSLLFVTSINVSALNHTIFENYIWTLEKSKHWIYNSKYNIAYITKDDNILIIFKDHLNKYGLFYVDPNSKVKNNQIFYKIDNKDFQSYDNLEYGSSITTDNTYSLIDSIRKKNSVTVTTSILYSQHTTFNLINSYDAIGLLNSFHPNNVLLNDININHESMTDIVNTGIQLTKTRVGKNKKNPYGYIHQWFEVDSESHDIPKSMYPKIILAYKRKECESNLYLWDGEISYHYSIKFKATAEVFEHQLDYLCFVY